MKVKLLLILGIFYLSACQKEQITHIDLAGIWEFQVDSLDVGINEKWYDTKLNGTITLPGSMTTNGKGNDVTMFTKWTGGVADSSWYTDDKYAKYRESGNIKVPFWLQPVKYYAGAAWYQKTVEIPSEWKNQYIELNLERCHWQTQVWVDDQDVGSQNSLATAHIYKLSDYLGPGIHTITVRVDNRTNEMDPGINAHSITDHTQSNWNGIVGDLSLSAKPNIQLEEIRIFPNVARGKVRIKADLINFTGKESTGVLTISTVLKSPSADPPNIQVEEKFQIPIDKKELEFEFSLGDEMGIWDEFYPNLYNLHVELETKTGVDVQDITFGMREITVDSTWFLVNGRPIFLRGTLECAIFPKTGYPPTDVDEWKKILNAVKAHGLNHVRFHSWCPPEAAFDAADKLGVYLQVECSSWANQSTSLGDGLPVDQYVLNEAERIVAQYGNHPSFCMMAYGNEPRGGNHMNFLANFVEHWKEKDNRRVYTGGAGWPILIENDYHNLPQPRIQGWGEELRSIINSQPPSTDFDWSEKIAGISIPVVSHEIGQWCVYPNFKEIEKYDGVLKAKNFEIFQEDLQEKGLGHLADSFLLASGKLQTLCYKADIEAALRTPGFAGFQLLDLHDFPGQGTALVGVLDPFWEEKGYVSPSAYRRFSGSTVPLARMEKRVFYTDESFVASVEAAHFGEDILPGVVPSWCITNQKDDTLFHNTFDTLDLWIGNNLPLGDLQIPLESITQPVQLTLVVDVNGFSNDWDFWVFPRKNKSIKNVLVTNKLNPQSIAYLNQGGSVLWSIPESTKSNNLNDAIGFSSIFWNTAWTGGQKPHSLGILCNPDHPALGEFPTEYHSNWQWWDAMSYSNAIVLDDFSKQILPTVRVIDDWFQNRSQALLFEVKVGNGKLMISGIDFFKNIDNRPEGKQLLFSLKKYMVSEQFNPKTELGISEIKNFL